MLMLMLPPPAVEAMRRAAFNNSTKLTLEIERHRAAMPQGMEDTDYLQYLGNALTTEMEIFEACNNALNFKHFIAERAAQ